MADFSTLGGVSQALQVGLDIAAVSGTTLTANVSANTKGAAVELLSAANNTVETNWVNVYIHASSGTVGAFLVDLMIGAATESVIIADMQYFHDSTGTQRDLQIFSLPLYIPKGQRISARCQSVTGSNTCNIHIVRHEGGFLQKPGATAQTIGAVTADSGGTLVTKGVGAYGSWQEITASLPSPIKGFCISAQRGVNSWSHGSVTYEVGVGAATEQTIYSGHLVTLNASETSISGVSPFIPIAIPAGERIAIRSASSISNVDFDLDFIIYGAS